MLRIKQNRLKELTQFGFTYVDMGSGLAEWVLDWKKHNGARFGSIKKDGTIPTEKTIEANHFDLHVFYDLIKADMIEKV